MECDPTARLAVLNLACPPLSMTVPSVALPSLKVTVPDGVPVVDFTVAVKVTMTPKVAGFSDETIVVVVGATSVSLNTVPTPEAPPSEVVPYRLPCESRTKPALEYAPSPPVPVKQYSTVSLPVVSTVNAVPQPYGALHARSPPELVVPYRLPCVSCTKPA